MKSYFLIFLFVSVSHFAKAQDTIKFNKPKSPIPAELLAGNNRLYYQLIFNRKITKNNKVGLLNISSLAADYKNDISKNEYLTTNVLYYEIYKGFSVHTGASFNTVEGIKPCIGLQYFYANKSFLLLYLPTYFYLHDQKIANLVILEYKPRLNKNWSIYTRLQASYAHNTEKNSHTRSYVYARLGLTYSNYTFGIGTNSDWYGPKKSFKNNDGFFLRVTI